MQDEEMEIDLLEILMVCKEHIVMFMVVGCIFVTAAFTYTQLFIPKQYTATAKIIIVQKKDAATTSVSATYTDVQLSQKLVNTYSQIIMSEAISDPVIANLRLDEEYGINTKKYNKMVTVAGANNTEVMNISVKTKDPMLSASIANEIVDVLQDKIYDIMQIENVSVLNVAKIPTQKSEPSTVKNMAIAGVFSVMLVGMYCVVLVLMDTKIKDEDEVKKIFTSYPIIGSIPDFVIEENGGAE